MDFEAEHLYGTFNRFEEKFKITRGQKEDLLRYLPKYCAFDPYCTGKTCYHIANLYYDTPDGEILRRSVERPKFKEKLRLRTYKMPVSPEDPVFLEIKRKWNARVNKRRIRLPYGDAVKLMEEGIQPVFADFENNQVLAEINYFLEMNPVRPAYFIAYDRLALTASDGSGIRITFDENIRERNTDLSLRENGGTPLLGEGECLMEIKSAGNFPLWLAMKLSELRLHSQSYSKVGSAHRYEIRGER